MAIASTFEQPRRISLGSWPGTSFDDTDANHSCAAEPWCDVGPWEGEVEFQVTKHRRVKEFQWRLRPDSPEAIAALEEAIHQADSLGLIPPKAKAKGLPSGTIRLGFGLSRRPLPSGSVPIGEIRLPYIRASVPVRILHQPTPEFPAGAVLARASGMVKLQFIVAENGLVPRESIRVIQADPSGFILPSVNAIVESRFQPAEAGGCPVKLLVEQRVRFKYR
jgi:hypothetical protein